MDTSLLTSTTRTDRNLRERLFVFSFRFCLRPLWLVSSHLPQSPWREDKELFVTAESAWDRPHWHRESRCPQKEYAPWGMKEFLSLACLT